MNGVASISLPVGLKGFGDEVEAMVKFSTKDQQLILQLKPTNMDIITITINACKANRIANIIRYFNDTLGSYPEDLPAAPASRVGMGGAERPL